MSQKEIFWTRQIPWSELLDKKKSQGKDGKLTFNVTYCPMFRHLKSQLVIMTIKKVFSDVPVAVSKNNNNLKSHLLRAALPEINEIGKM